MAKKGFSFAIPLDGIAVRPDELLRGASLAAAAAADRVRAGVNRVTDSVARVAEREGDRQLQTRQQQAQLVQTVAAKAPRALRASGAYSPRNLPAQPSVAGGRQSSQVMRAVGELGESAVAGLKGFQSALFAGQDDRVTALVRTAFGQGGDGPAWKRAMRNLEYQQEYSARQAAEHPIATSVGENVGIGTSLAVGNPISAGRSLLYTPVKASAKALAGQRLVTKPVELASIAAVSGGGNAIAEHLVDRAVGNDPTLGHAAGAWIGGATGALTTMAVGPRAGAASEAFVTPLMQGALTGEAQSAEDIRDRMIGAGIGANRGEVAAVRRIANYTPSQKGELGERLSTLKTLARLQLPRSAHKSIELEAGGRTFVDHLTNIGDVIEAKFGEFARLSKQQKKAKLQFGDRYRYDHWKASDAAKIAGYLEGVVAAKLTHPLPQDAGPEALPIPNPPPKTPPRF